MIRSPDARWPRWSGPTLRQTDSSNQPGFFRRPDHEQPDRNADQAGQARHEARGLAPRTLFIWPLADPSSSCTINTSSQRTMTRFHP